MITNRYLSTVALLLCATATPALAQRIDTRTEDVVERDGIVRCRSHAYPELQLRHQGAEARGQWVSLAREPGEEQRAQFGINLRPQTGQRFNVAADVVGMRLRNAHTLPRAVSAQLRLDGADRPTGIQISFDDSDPTMLYASIADDQSAALAEALMNVRVVEIELRGADAAKLASFSWDVSKFRTARELLDVIKWNCRQPL